MRGAEWKEPKLLCRMCGHESHQTTPEGWSTGTVELVEMHDGYFKPLCKVCRDGLILVAIEQLEGLKNLLSQERAS